jgi:hypothetical protein
MDVSPQRLRTRRAPLQDQQLDEALKGLRFKPAIEQGTPVETMVPIRLGMIASM